MERRLEVKGVRNTVLKKANHGRGRWLSRHFQYRTAVSLAGLLDTVQGSAQQQFTAGSHTDYWLALNGLSVCVTGRCDSS